MNDSENAQSDDRDRTMADRWQTLSQSERIQQRFDELHDKILQATSDKQPKCETSGRCCHFEKFGHRLYITGLEAAVVLNRLIEHPIATDIDQAITRGDCPFLISEQCSIHEQRPTGCRIFFCDPDAEEWQHNLYERVHERIERLHMQHDVPYHYGEWRAMLRWCVTGENRAIDFPNDAENGSNFVQVRLP